MMFHRYRSDYETIHEDDPPSSNSTRYPKIWLMVALLVAVVAAASIGFYNFWTPNHNDIPKLTHSQVLFGHSRDNDEVHQILQQMDHDIAGKVLFRHHHSNHHHHHEDEHKDQFEQASHVWNECALPPLAVVQVANEADVQRAIPSLAHLLEQHHIPFRIKSGGHSYTGWSGVGDGIILSLSELNHVILNESTGVATLGPAATVQDVLAVALPRGYGGVVGFCPGVAEGGFALGGGLGVQSRLYGLGLDNIVAARVVLHDGSVVVASVNDDPDLFFALRGAGQNSYGVVTELQYQLHPLGETVEFGQELVAVEGMVPIEDVKNVNVALGNMEQDLPNNWLALFEGNLDPDGPRAFPFMLLYTGNDMDGAKVYAKDTLCRHYSLRRSHPPLRFKRYLGTTGQSPMGIWRATTFVLGPGFWMLVTTTNLHGRNYGGHDGSLRFVSLRYGGY